MPERSASNTTHRRIVRFTGHVQGVGFRYTVRKLAERFAVSGFVRNLADGSVEMIVEGKLSDIDALVKSIQQRMDQFIRKIDESTQPATGEFSDFAIRH